MPYETDNHRNSFRFSGYPEKAENRDRTEEKRKIKATAQIRNRIRKKTDQEENRSGKKQKDIRNRFSGYICRLSHSDSDEVDPVSRGDVRRSALAVDL